MATSNAIQELFSLNLSSASTILLLVIVVAIMLVNGFALWKAARLKEKGWFWVLLLTNTAGILPGIYLYMRRDKRV